MPLSWPGPPVYTWAKHHHGRLTRRKAYLFAFIDDMSRLIVHAELYLAEGLAPLAIGLAPGSAQTGATTQVLPRQRPSLPFPPPGKDHRLPGHRPGPLTTRRAPGQGQGRKIFPHRQVPALPLLKGRYPSRHQ
ncbi:hypothetical protein DFAR_3740009 [Desulfarculales bacterium]